jgi:hypothetical protein
METIKLKASLYVSMLKIRWNSKPKSAKVANLKPKVEQLCAPILKGNTIQRQHVSPSDGCPCKSWLALFTIEQIYHNFCFVLKKLAVIAPCDV